MNVKSIWYVKRKANIKYKIIHVDLPSREQHNNLLSISGLKSENKMMGLIIVSGLTPREQSLCHAQRDPVYMQMYLKQ